MLTRTLRVIPLYLGSHKSYSFVRSNEREDFNQLLLYSHVSNLGHWYSISLLFIFQYCFVCTIKKNPTTVSQGRMSFSDESSDPHVLVYKLLTALGFIEMKDALFIVL